MGGTTMVPVKIAIIDTQVNLALFDKKQIIEAYEIKGGQVKKKKNSHLVKGVTHSIICIGVLRHFTDLHKIYSIEVMSSASRRGNIEDLLSALDWCMAHEIELIHLSIGTTNFREFKKVKCKIDQVIEAGIIVVAASSNNNRITYPAALPGVIGVRADDSLRLNTYIYHNNPIDGIEISACLHCTVKELFGDDLERFGYNADFILTQSNSYTAPFITAKVCELMSKGIRNIKVIKAVLQEQATGLKGTISDEVVISKKNLILKDVVVPNIIIYCAEHKQSLLLVRKLIECFFEDQYYCVALMDSINSIELEGSIYVIDENKEWGIRSIKEKLQYLYGITEADCIITVVETEEVLELLRKDKLIDVLIMGNSNIKPYLERKIAEKVINIEWSRTSIKDIYMTCKKILE